MGFKCTMTMNLQHKTAIITGATRGLGKAIAERFWQQGANLILIARDQKKLQQIMNDFSDDACEEQTAIAHSLDLANANEVEKFAALLAQEYKIDILVNNAAVQGPIGPLWENDQTYWQATLQVNLLSPITLSRAVLP